VYAVIHKPNYKKSVCMYIYISRYTSQGVSMRKIREWIYKQGLHTSVWNDSPFGFPENKTGLHRTS